MKKIACAVLTLLVVPTAALAKDRDYCPTRPGLGTTPCTIAPGRVSVETALTDWTLEQDSTQRSDTVLIGDTFARLGLSDSIEAQVGWTPFGHVRTRDKLAGTVDSTGRVGDVTLGLKANLLHPDGSGVSIAVQPFALLNRTDKTASVDTWTLHSGPFGAFDGSVSFGPNYSDVLKASTVSNAGKPNWLGFTDIYWMSTLIPDTGAQGSDFRALGNGIYLADLFYPVAAVAPGQQLAHTTRLFAGAKESAVLDRYEAAGITNFGKAIDWGWFFWFEKPIFWLLKATSRSSRKRR